MALSPLASTSAQLTLPDAVCALTYDPLDTSKVISSVQDDGAGATAVFIGTTRDSFEGKTVTRLEYQAYTSLAMKTLHMIVLATQLRFRRSDHAPSSTSTSSCIRCAIHHRLGTVSVGEPSIVIAVSSPHRKEAFDACEFILEEVKRKAQIWKKEHYAGEGDAKAEWKANII